MNTKRIIIASILISTLCIEELDAQSTGGDLDPNKCIRSAGYIWSSIKKDCIRSFELETQLVNKDNIFYASILFSASKDSVEVFSTEGQFILTRKKKNYYIGTNEEVSLFIQKNKSKWQIGNRDTDEILYIEK